LAQAITVVQHRKVEDAIDAASTRRSGNNDPNSSSAAAIFSNVWGHW